MPSEEAGPPKDSAHANRLDALRGGVGGVVQARDVHGDVHFHHDEAPFAVTPLQLPGDVRGFVNRRAELKTLATIVADDQAEPPTIAVAVITGTAGVGKTSLALHWAHRVRHYFPDGQLYANLRGFGPSEPADPAQVLGRFLVDLGVSAAAVPADVEGRAALYRSLLATRRMLVILDNAACARQARPLLPGATTSLTMVTSRSRLSGLVARDGAFRLDLDVLPEQDAVALLEGAIAPYRSSDEPQELVELARLCARLPLALRVAAERAASHPMMPIDDLIADLRDESGLWDALTAEDGEDADAVRSVFAWSYRALPEPAARLFRLLGMHPGNDFSLPAAAALVGAPTVRVRHDLEVLVGAHLLEQYAPGRYEFHDLLRAYAADQVRELETPEARAEVLQRVLTWYLYSADAAQARMSPYDWYPLEDPVPADVVPLVFDTYKAAFRWYRQESTNLVRATNAAAGAGLYEVAWRLAAVLGRIYMYQWAFEDWFTTSGVGVEAAASAGDRRGEAQVLESLGRAYFQSWRLNEAEANHRAALAIRQDLEDRFGEAISINALGLLGTRRRRLREAQSFFEQSRAIFEELSEPRFEALVRGNLAETLYELGQSKAASQILREALIVARELRDSAGEGAALFHLSRALRELSEITQARAAIDGALRIADQEENQAWRGNYLIELGMVQRAAGRPDEALVSCQEAASIQRQLGDRSREALAIDGAGLAYADMGRFIEATEFHRAAAITHRELADHWNLAQALNNLAIALERSGSPAEAWRYREEVLQLLSEFDDPQAMALRDEIAKVLRSR